MMSWTLWLLLATTDGSWKATDIRTFDKPGVCQKVAREIQNRKEIGGMVVYAATCKESIDT